jgi:Lrp/AsnC family transcriptional regulator, leucine-responsive regulatory protein
MNTSIEVDDYDEAILRELQLDARLSMAELGRRVHLSQPAVTELAYPSGYASSKNPA